MIERESKTLFTSSKAIYSDCEAYRYLLTRIWDQSLPSITFLMLNPSTATEVVNDPTIERCERRARNWNYGTLHILNLFALRSTDPKKLYSHPDPIGPDNNSTIGTIVPASKITICAWGTHGKLLNRAEEVRAMLASTPLHYLALSKDGFPMHPLYLSYALKPQEWMK